VSRQPRIDVVILTWNDGPLLDAAARSVAASEGVDARLVVVDNGSDPPASVDVPGATIVRNDVNRGVAAGRNQGVAHGDAPLVCFLDSDAVVAPHSLAALVAPFAEADIGITVPVFDGQAPEASAGRAPTLLTKISRVSGRRAEYDPAPGGTTGERWSEVEFGIGACQVFRRTVFDEVGGLDESFFYGPEDVDFCLRARALGWRTVQVDGANVQHPPRRAFRRPLTLRGARHGWAVARYLVRHRRFV
jgi:GT2 family glycosyltransferase